MAINVGLLWPPLSFIIAITSRRQASLAKHVIMSLDDDPAGRLLYLPSDDEEKYFKTSFVHFLIAVRHTEALNEIFAPRLNQYWTITAYVMTRDTFH